MKYILSNIKSTGLGKFEITFSNGVNRATANVVSLDKDDWCLYSATGKAIDFYPSVEDLINNFEKILNESTS